MNFFESELKKIMENSGILKDQKYVGCICYGTISEDLRARVEFVTLGVSNHYTGLKTSISSSASIWVPPRLLLLEVGSIGSKRFETPTTL